MDRFGSFNLTLRGDIYLKGKGIVQTYWLDNENNRLFVDRFKFLNKIEIHIDRIDCDQYPEFVDDTITTTNASSTNHDESYEIKVEAENGKCRIASKTIWGMIRALETFSQLFYMDKQNCMIVIDVVQVWDRPRFRYRSIMIDTARHYLPLWIILQNLVIIMNLDNIITY